MLRKLKRILFFIFVLIYLFFEELIWNKIALPIHAYIKSLRLYEKFLLYTEKDANRYVVLLFFILPFVLAELLGIIAGIFLAKLYILPAVFIYLLKIPLAIVAFGVLKAGKEKLNSFGLFFILYQFTIQLLDRLHNSQIYIAIKNMLVAIKTRLLYAKNKVLYELQRIYKQIRES